MERHILYVRHRGLGGRFRAAALPTVADAEFPLGLKAMDRKLLLSLGDFAVHTWFLKQKACVCAHNMGSSRNRGPLYRKYAPAEIASHIPIHRTHLRIAVVL